MAAHHQRVWNAWNRLDEIEEFEAEMQALAHAGRRPRRIVPGKVQ